MCAQLAGWTENDTLAERGADIANLITQAVGAQEAAGWQAHIGAIPQQITLKELRDYVSADSDEDEFAVLEAVFAPLGQPVPVAQVLPPRVRVMTMHGAKGLSARVVFVPGLEEQLIPGPRRAPIPGLVLESARLLYVSITRARAALILSRAGRRYMNGRSQAHNPSRFAVHLGGQFGWRANGATAAEAQQIMAECAQI